MNIEDAGFVPRTTLLDPDPDPGGLKTYGFYGSGPDLQRCLCDNLRHNDPMVGGPAELLPKLLLGIEQRRLGARVPHQDAASGARLQVGEAHKALQEGGLLRWYAQSERKIIKLIAKL